MTTLDSLKVKKISFHCITLTTAKCTKHYGFCVTNFKAELPIGGCSLVV